MTIEYWEQWDKSDLDSWQGIDIVEDERDDIVWCDETECYSDDPCADCAGCMKCLCVGW